MRRAGADCKRVLSIRVLSIALFLSFVGSVWAGTVKVEGGLVQGTVEDGLSIYRGIPYAVPPIGDLRWRPPQPAVKWNGVRDADKFGPPCIQSNPAIANPAAPSEDCLYINAWTPVKAPSDRLAVLFWVHGGGFTAGEPAEQLYHGEHLAKKDVVVVTVSYRLGALGFLAHPGLSAESTRHVSGNYGLLDMIAGLQWVQRNIAGFGCDPKRITIFGESAGGIAVSMLCASPLTKGLFQGAMSGSGGSFGPVSGAGPGENVRALADAESAGVTWAAAAGAATVADMRRLPAEKVLAATLGQRGVTWPIMDRYVIPDDQYLLCQAGRYSDVPILVGYNSDEGATFSPPASPGAYLEAVKQRYGSFADSLIAADPAGDTTVAKTARDLSRDAMFGWHTWVWAGLQTNTGKSKVFLYYFDQHPDYAVGSPRAGFGSAHGSEVPFVFGQMDRPNRPPTSDEDKALSDVIENYWTNFAKTGDPNGAGLPVWPIFNPTKPETMRFSHTAQRGSVDNEEGLVGSTPTLRHVARPSPARGPVPLTTPARLPSDRARRGRRA